MQTIVLWILLWDKWQLWKLGSPTSSYYLHAWLNKHRTDEVIKIQKKAREKEKEKKSKVSKSEALFICKLRRLVELWFTIPFTPANPAPNQTKQQSTTKKKNGGKKKCKNKTTFLVRCRSFYPLHPRLDFIYRSSYFTSSPSKYRFWRSTFAYFNFNFDHRFRERILCTITTMMITMITTHTHVKWSRMNGYVCLCWVFSWSF